MRNVAYSKQAEDNADPGEKRSASARSGPDPAMRGTVPASLHPLALPFAWLANILPVVAFYLIFLRGFTNLPQMDDYDAVLGFLNGFVSLQGLRNRLLYFLSSQHVQYKLFFEHLVVLLEVALTGHVNFVFLQQLGNLFVLLTVLVLWRMFQPGEKTGARRLLLFAPAVFLLFAPRYGETLSWAMGSLQNLTVIFFSVLSLYLLARATRVALIAGTIAMICAISSSGNGFFLALVGFALLLQRRRRLAALLWVLVTAAMTALYAYHYNLGVAVPPAVSSTHPFWTAVLFPLVFLGGASAKIGLAIPLTVLLLTAAAFLIAKNWRRADPPTFYATCFIVITAAGVGLTRHRLGLDAALAGKYVIYGQIFAALLYLSAINLGLERLISRARSRPLLGSFAVLTLIFCIISDIKAIRDVRHRTSLIRDHYVGWSRDPDHISLVPDEGPYALDPAMPAFRRRAVAILAEARVRGLYKPPDPTDLGSERIR